MCCLSTPTSAALAWAAAFSLKRSGRLETFEWQAPAFYRKHGYEDCARIDDYTHRVLSFLLEEVAGTVTGFSSSAAGQERPPAHRQNAYTVNWPVHI